MACAEQQSQSGNSSNDDRNDSTGPSVVWDVWTVYGLGTENQNLPAFVVLLDKTGGPLGGAQLWSAGFIPASYQERLSEIRVTRSRT
jgi:hypothetical protein